MLELEIQVTAPRILNKHDNEINFLANGAKCDITDTEAMIAQKQLENGAEGHIDNTKGNTLKKRTFNYDDR